MSRNTLIDIQVHEVISVRHITDSTYVLRLNRNGLKFIPGQYVSIGKAGKIDKRDYSIYSSTEDDFLEVIIREVKDGSVSKSLKNCKPGDKIELEGPFGFFRIKPEDVEKGNFLFIASGTGISPFHSMVKSTQSLNYKMLHGVRNSKEGYDKADYSTNNHVLCTSRDGSGDYYGRVTDYLRENPVSKDTLCYLCGNVEMINDVYDILEEQGVPSGNMHAEVYF